MTTTSEAWWKRTKKCPEAMEKWLVDQYRGEARAATRITQVRDAFTEPGGRAYRVLTVIAAQEEKHAAWVGELLALRGKPAQIEDKADRYWPHVLGVITDLETFAGVGAHAERMRLERICVIAGDEGAPADVREVFAKILREERFHERAFRSLAGDEALARTAPFHALGREALGLSP